MEKLIKLYIDKPRWEDGVHVDDFLVSIGQKKSNSVYHVANVRMRGRGIGEHRIIRYHVKVYKSDLITALKRDDNQLLHTLRWYRRRKGKI